MPIDQHPWIIYTSLVIGVLLLIVNAVPKVLGPIGTALTDWSRTRRENRIAQGQAEMSEVQMQVAFLTEQRERDRAEHAVELAEQKTEQEVTKEEMARYRRLWAEREQRWRTEWQNHLGWDYAMINLALKHGLEPPPPAPPFMTPDPYATPSPNSMFSANPEEG